MLKNDFGLIFWTHLLLILVYISSPFWLGWQWIAFLLFAFFLQDRVFRRCLLTSAQLKNRDDVSDDELSFYVYYFKKMGLKFNTGWVKKYFAWSLAWAVLVFSLVWQMLLLQDTVLIKNLF